MFIESLRSLGPWSGISGPESRVLAAKGSILPTRPTGLLGPADYGADPPGKSSWFGNCERNASKEVGEVTMRAGLLGGARVLQFDRNSAESRVPKS